MRYRYSIDKGRLFSSKFSVYDYADNLRDELEGIGVISGFDGSKQLELERLQLMESCKQLSDMRYHLAELNDLYSPYSEKNCVSIWETIMLEFLLWCGRDTVQGEVLVDI